MAKEQRVFTAQQIFELSERMKPLLLDLNVLVNKSGLTRLEENYKILLFQISRMYIYDMHDVQDLLSEEFMQKLNKLKAFAVRSSYQPEADEKSIVEEMIQKLRIDVPTDGFEEDRQN